MCDLKSGMRRISPSYFTHRIMFPSYIVFGCHVALFGCETFNPDSTMTSGHLPGSISVICINFPEPPQTTRRLESWETMVFLIYMFCFLDVEWWNENVSWLDMTGLCSTVLRVPYKSERSACIIISLLQGPSPRRLTVIYTYLQIGSLYSL